MDKNLLDLIDEAIALEMTIGKLYSLFSRKCDEDKGFWLQLETEEYNHASLLKAAKEFVAYSKFPSGLIPQTTDQIKQSVMQINQNYQQFDENPDRLTAFSMGYEMENIAGEMHYQQFMESADNDELRNLFKKLNRFDNDHSKRILAYWTKVTQERNQT